MLVSRGGMHTIMDSELVIDMKRWDDEHEHEDEDAGAAEDEATTKERVTLIISLPLSLLHGPKIAKQISSSFVRLN